LSRAKTLVEYFHFPKSAQMIGGYKLLKPTKSIIRREIHFDSKSKKIIRSFPKIISKHSLFKNVTIQINELSKIMKQTLEKCKVLPLTTENCVVEMITRALLCLSSRYNIKTPTSILTLSIITNIIDKRSNGLDIKITISIHGDHSIDESTYIMTTISKELSDFTYGTFNWICTCK
jgi:hypothetical protein